VDPIGSVGACSPVAHLGWGHLSVHHLQHVGVYVIKLPINTTTTVCTDDESRLTQLTSVPSFTSSLTTSRFPFSTAKNSAVAPSPVGESILAPANRSMMMMLLICSFRNKNVVSAEV
jgi:hypothetical protein